MNVLFVDDEALSLHSTTVEAKKIKYIGKIFSSSTSKGALEIFENNIIDVAVLDIEIDEMTGLQLAAKLKEIDKNVSIIFLTAYANYAINAFKLKVDGYLMKPMNSDDLHKELEIIYKNKNKQAKKVFIKTFGNFEVLVSNNAVHFSSAKAKELLAYMVTMRGTSVSSNECLDNIWDAYNNFYTNDFFRKAVFELNHILKAENIDYIFENSRNAKRVIPDTFDCDFYNFLDNDINTIKTYYGKFLSNYEWARDIEKNLLEQKKIIIVNNTKED